MQCEEWDDANSELFKESHDEAVHKNSYKSRLYELISASLTYPLALISKRNCCPCESGDPSEIQECTTSSTCHGRKEKFSGTVFPGRPVGGKAQGGGRKGSGGELSVGDGGKFQFLSGRIQRCHRLF